MKNLIKGFLIFAFSTTFIPLIYAQDEVEEVVVTANKKEQTAQEIPMNISVITEQVMLERGIYKPEDFLRTLAGVSTPGGYVYYTIRGLNTSTAQTSSGTTISSAGNLTQTSFVVPNNLIQKQKQSSSSSAFDYKNYKENKNNPHIMKNLY